MEAVMEWINVEDGDVKIVEVEEEADITEDPVIFRADSQDTEAAVTDETAVEVVDEVEEVVAEVEDIEIESHNKAKMFSSFLDFLLMLTSNSLMMFLLWSKEILKLDKMENLELKSTKKLVIQKVNVQSYFVMKLLHNAFLALTMVNLFLEAIAA